MMRLNQQLSTIRRYRLLEQINNIFERLKLSTTTLRVKDVEQLLDDIDQLIINRTYELKAKRKYKYERKNILRFSKGSLTITPSSLR